LWVLAVMLALSVAPVQAAVKHDYLSQFSEVPAGAGVTLPGPVTGVGAMTVDSGHLWVAEIVEGTGTLRVDEFDAVTGAFVSQLPQESGFSELGLGVAVAHGSVYVAADQVPGGSGGLGVFSEAGSLLGSWTGAHTPTGPFSPGAFDVAVDRSVSSPAAGSVYVADERQRVVDVFRPEGVGKEPPVVEPSAEHVVQLTGTCPVEGTACEPLEVIPFNRPERVTVDDSTGDLLVMDQRDVVDVFRLEVLGGYVFVRQIKPPRLEGSAANSIAVDGNTGEIYAAVGFSPGFVDEFSSAGVFLGRITGEDTPGGDLRVPQSVAVDPGSHRVFVGDKREGYEPRQPAVIDVFGPDIVIPDVMTGPVSNLAAYSARLTGTVKLDKEGEASCQFLWGTSREFDHTAPCSAPVTEEESAVHADLEKALGSELEPDTTYYYRLQASNKNGLNPGEPSQDQQFTTPGPGIHEEAVSNVAAGSVTFNASINPHNTPTTYYFQYALTSAYGTNLPAAPGLPLGSGEGDVEAIPQHVQEGLLPSTVYHYRVVAVSELSPGRFEEFDGPDQTFTTQPASSVGSGLLDGRSWELVTPPEKKGAYFQPIGDQGLIQASSNGDAIADLASQPTEAEPLGVPAAGVSVLSTRGVAGWSSQVISPPHAGATGVPTGEGVEYRFFSEDLSLGVVQPFGQVFTPLSPEATEATAYLRTVYSNGDVSSHCQSECFRPLVTAGNTPPGTVFGGGSSEASEAPGECRLVRCGARFVVATPDLSHVVLKVRGLGVVEWTGGKLTSTGGVFPPVEGWAQHSISNDGSRVVGYMGEEALSTGLFLRDMVKGETIRLDVPQGGSGIGPHELLYMDSSSDDSRIFFVDSDHLTAESSAGGKDLYEYDVNAPVGSRLTDLSVARNRHEGADTGGSDVLYVLGASEDGSYVYFVAGGVLAPGAKHGECSIVGGITHFGMCNLYVAHAGTTRLVVALSPEDQADWAASNVRPGLKDMPVRVSPDGRWLAFMSSRNLTGYDTRDAVSGHPDEEVYLYDANGAKLVCASCNPSGARPVGVMQYGGLVDITPGYGTPWTASNVPPWTMESSDLALYQSRYLSDTGRLFFNSNDALVPQDVNGTEDVYEFEAPGVGGCTVSQPLFSQRSGGCVGLVSSGTSGEESAFLDASSTGGDVFFLTSSKLVSQDFDTALDVYDAHECSTSAPCFAVPPAVPPVCSTGDSCKAAPTPQPPVFGAPSSATFSGAGNVVPSGSAPVLQLRGLTRAQKLAQALRACRKKHNPKQKSVCERKAKQRFGAKRARRANATKTGRG
jgi:WD40-like Beta Propeller Repeat